MRSDESRIVNNGDPDTKKVNAGSPSATNWRISTDTPVTGDWNGDGRTEVGVFRPFTYMFYLKNGTTTTSVNWGISTDLPVTGKW